MNRRGFIGGLISAVAAPLVVRSGVLMPLRGLVMPGFVLPDVKDYLTLDQYSEFILSPMVNYYRGEWEKRVADSVFALEHDGLSRYFKVAA